MIVIPDHTAINFKKMSEKKVIGLNLLPWNEIFYISF